MDIITVVGTNGKCKTWYKACIIAFLISPIKHFMVYETSFRQSVSLSYNTEMFRAITLEISLLFEKGGCAEDISDVKILNCYPS